MTEQRPDEPAEAPAAPALAVLRPLGHARYSVLAGVVARRAKGLTGTLTSRPGQAPPTT